MLKDIIVVGDLHGVWGPINAMIKRETPSIILQCGDFGWWPKLHNTTHIWSGEYEDISDEVVGDPWQRCMAKRVPKPWNQFGLKNKDAKIYWCDGNHEDHLDLIKERNYMKAPCEMMPNVYYMKRGSVLQLRDGRNILFMGGADSIDKGARTPGVDWFPEEVITQSDIYNLPDVGVDVVVSHTCPMEFHKAMLKAKRSQWGWQKKIRDPSASALSYILNRYKPDLWYFGHFHTFLRGKYRDTKWYCLNTVGQPNWWVYLEELQSG